MCGFCSDSYGDLLEQSAHGHRGSMTGDALIYLYRRAAHTTAGQQPLRDAISATRYQRRGPRAGSPLSVERWRTALLCTALQRFLQLPIFPRLSPPLGGALARA